MKGQPPAAARRNGNLFEADAWQGAMRVAMLVIMRMRGVNVAL